VVKGEGKATGKVVGRVKVKPNGLPDSSVITSNWVNYLLWPQCLNGVRHQSAWSPPSGLSPPQSPPRHDLPLWCWGSYKVQCQATVILLWTWSLLKTLMSSLCPMSTTATCRRPCILSPSQSRSAKNTSFHGSMSRISRTATPLSIAESASAQCVASGIPDRPMRQAGKRTWRARTASPTVTSHCLPRPTSSYSSRHSAASPCFRSPFYASTKMPSWITSSKVASPYVQLAVFISKSSLFRWQTDTSRHRLEQSYGGSPSCTASWSHCWRHFCAALTLPSPWRWTVGLIATWRASMLSPRTGSTSFLWPTRTFSWRSLMSSAGLASATESGLPCSNT